MKASNEYNEKCGTKGHVRAARGEGESENFTQCSIEVEGTICVAQDYYYKSSFR